MVRTCMAIALFAALSLDRPALAEKPKLAVMPLVAKRLPQPLVSILDELVVVQIDNSQRYQVLGASDIDAMMGFEKMKDAVGCSNASCAAEIGGALGVSYLVTGSVGLLGDEIIVQLSLIDVKGAISLRRGRAVVKNDERLYRKAAEAACAELLGISPPTEPVQTTMAPPTKTPPLPPKALPISPAQFRFDTRVVGRQFTVSVTTVDGRTQSCQPLVHLTKPCLLQQLAIGRAHLAVSHPDLYSFVDTFKVRDKNRLYDIHIEVKPTAGAVVAFSFGGITLATGAALLATGIPLQNKGLISGGVPNLITGVGLLILGAVLKKKIMVDYPGIDIFF